MTIQALVCLFMILLVAYVTPSYASSDHYSGNSGLAGPTVNKKDTPSLIEAGHNISASSRIHALRGEIRAKTSSSVDDEVEAEFQREMAIIKQKARHFYDPSAPASVPASEPSEEVAQKPVSLVETGVETGTKTQSTLHRTGIFATARTSSEAGVNSSVDSTLSALTKKYRPASSSASLSDYLLGTKAHRAQVNYEQVQKFYPSTMNTARPVAPSSLLEASAATFTAAPKPAARADADAFAADLASLESLMGSTHASDESSFASLVTELHAHDEAHEDHEDAADEDVGDLFDFSEPAHAAEHATEHEEEGSSLLEVGAAATVQPQPGNSPGWPFASPAAPQQGYAPPAASAGALSVGYSLGDVGSLAQRSSGRVSNHLDVDDVYSNFNGRAGAPLPGLNGGQPEDVYMQRGGAAAPPYPASALQTGAFLPPQGALSADPASMPPEPDHTRLDGALAQQAGDAQQYYQQHALLQEQKTAAPYFPQSSPLPLPANAAPAPYSQMAAQGTPAQYAVDPAASVPTSSLSQDALVTLGHTGHLPAGDGNVSPYQRSSLTGSFLQTQQPSLAGGPAPAPTDFAAYQQQQQQQAASGYGYAPSPYAGVSAPPSPQPQGQVYAPGTSLYPIDAMALNSPLRPPTSAPARASPYGPYSTYAPAQSVNQIEVNPDLHPVQYMADTPYFPTEPMGDDILPPAPIEQPMHPSGPVAGMMDPRMRAYGNSYIPSAPYLAQIPSQ